MSAIEASLCKIERRYRRIALSSKWSLFRMGLIAMCASFLGGIVASAYGASFPWYKIFLTAFIFEGLLVAISWTLGLFLSLVQRSWLGAGILIAPTLAVFVFTYLAFRTLLNPNWPNQQPDGTPVKSPPSNPGQVSGVPHP